MVQNFQDNRQKYILESQIRDEYGKLVYTYTCHNYIISRYKFYDNIIKGTQIVLSAVTTGSFLSIILGSKEMASYIGAICSLILLISNACSKSFDINDKINSHKKASNALWLLRENYISLIADIPILGIGDIMEKRDELIIKTSEIYNQSPNTDGKSYKKAQEALKSNEEQFFTDDEIDKMLPVDLRRCNRRGVCFEWDKN
ncbi:SLATT domain-containing protein [Clostridium perfringens]